MSNGTDQPADLQRAAHDVETDGGMNAAVATGSALRNDATHSKSEMRPKEDDPRKSDGVETFKRMESDVARHKRQADQEP